MRSTRRALASRGRKSAWGCENQEHPMPRATSSTNVIATIGIDIGKNTYLLPPAICSEPPSTAVFVISSA